MSRQKNTDKSTQPAAAADVPRRLSADQVASAANWFFHLVKNGFARVFDVKRKNTTRSNTREAKSRLW